MDSNRKLYQNPKTWVVFSGLVFAILVFLLFTTASKSPEPTTTFEIVTKPEGATVFWNAVEKGSSPITIQSKGKLTGNLVITMNGYREINRQISLEAGKSQRIRYDLEFETYMKVESDPIGAKIYVDGKFWGSTPMTFDGLISPGNHELKIDDTEYCFGETTKKIVLEQRKRLEIKENLPKLSLVTITSNPKGAMVEANGKQWGTTPLSKCVALGKYKVKFVKTGLVTEERDLEIKEDFSYTVRLYDKEHYKLKDSYTVSADQKDATITAIALAAGEPPQVVGTPVTFDKAFSINKDEMYKKSGLDGPPFAYVFIAAKAGYSPGILQVNEPGEYNLTLKSISSLSAKIQASHADYSSTSSPYPDARTSPDGKFTIKVSDDGNAATLTDGTTEKMLYLKDQTEVSGNSFAWATDSSAVFYFRNNKDARELVRVNLSDMKEMVVDIINLKDNPWTKQFPSELLFNCFNSVCYDSGILYYLVPGSGQKQLSLCAKLASGGTARKILQRDMVPIADKYSIWMDSPGVLKIGGVFTGSKYYEGIYSIAQGAQINIKIQTPEKVNIGNFKTLDSDFVMYESMHCIDKVDEFMIVAVRLYSKLDGLFMYDTTSGYFELPGVKVQ